MHEDDRDQLERVTAIIKEVLGANAAGAYLFGSAVRGGLQPESDLDLLVVTRRRMTHGEKHALVARLLPISGRETPAGRWRRVEVTVVVHDEVSPWRYPARFDFQYGDWLRREFEDGNVEPWETTVSPDLALLITMALLADAVVFGPSAADMLGPVPREHVVQATLDSLDHLDAALGDDTRNVLLTFARMWSTLATGAIRSKAAAAEWALVRLPEEHRPVLERARVAYLGGEAERWDDIQEHLRPYIDHVTAEITRLAGDDSPAR